VTMRIRAPILVFSRGNAVIASGPSVPIGSYRSSPCVAPCNSATARNGSIPDLFHFRIGNFLTSSVIIVSPVSGNSLRAYTFGIQAAGCLYAGYWAIFFGSVTFLIITSYLREHRHHPAGKATSHEASIATRK